MLLIFLQLEAAESEESLRAIFEDSNHQLAMWETGYRKPFSSLQLGDREELQMTLKVHMLARIKPELDQFREGLKACGILEAMQARSTLMEPLFTYSPSDLTAGLFCA